MIKDEKTQSPKRYLYFTKKIIVEKKDDPGEFWKFREDFPECIVSEEAVRKVCMTPPEQFVLEGSAFWCNDRGTPIDPETEKKSAKEDAGKVRYLYCSNCRSKVPIESIEDPSNRTCPECGKEATFVNSLQHLDEIDRAAKKECKTIESSITAADQKLIQSHYGDPLIKQVIMDHAKEGKLWRAGNGDFAKWYKYDKDIVKLFDLTNPDDYNYLTTHHRSLYWTLNFFDEKTRDCSIPKSLHDENGNKLTIGTFADTKKYSLGGRCPASRFSRNLITIADGMQTKGESR